MGISIPKLPSIPQGLQNFFWFWVRANLLMFWGFWTSTPFVALETLPDVLRKASLYALWFCWGYSMFWGIPRPKKED